MAKVTLREKALLLRDMGYSYSQIKKVVQVSKSTLSLWLRNKPLSKERITDLKDKNSKRIENFRVTMKQKREQVLERALAVEKKKVSSLSKKELYILGLILYWAEGTKTWDSRTEITNSDPILLRVFIQWLKREGVKTGKIKIKLHLYSSMDVNEEIDFWSKYLNIPKQQFYKPIIKKTNRKSYKGTHGHGTCQVIYGNRKLNDQIYAGIQQLKSFFL